MFAELHETAGRAIQRVDLPGRDVVGPAVERHPVLGEGQRDRRMRAQVGDLGDHILADHSIERRRVRPVAPRGVDGLGRVGVAQPMGHRRVATEIMVVCQRSHRTAIGMAANHHFADAKHRHRIFNAGRDATGLGAVRRHNVPGVADDEHLTRLPLSEELGHDAAIRAADEQDVWRLCVSQRAEEILVHGEGFLAKPAKPFDQLFHETSRSRTCRR
jgi:hypothetical protein